MNNIENGPPFIPGIDFTLGRPEPVDPELAFNTLADRDETSEAHTLFRALFERKYLADAAQREAEIRAELTEKVRVAMEAVDEREMLIGWDCMADETIVNWDALAEAAVDALADYYRAQLNQAQSSEQVE